MKLLRFTASGVHGYLDFDANFLPEVNFFAGLNGSGKTTALNMITAILTPSIDQLIKIKFSNASLIVEKSSEIIKIECIKNNDELIIEVSDDRTIIGRESFSFDEYAFLSKKSNYSRKSSAVIRQIRQLTPPMFLSLDRRFIKSSREDEHHDKYYDYFNEIRNTIGSSNDSSLDEVISIVGEISAENKFWQTTADKKLRNDIILDSLSFSKAIANSKFPNNHTLSILRKKQIAIKKTFDNLDVPSDEFETKYNTFFDKLETLVRKVDSLGESRPINLSKNNEGDFNEVLSEWFINQHQLTRIDRLFSMVEKYQEEKNKKYTRLTRFENLVNSFLNETGKKIELTNKGKLVIKFSGEERDLSVLSSGERQIIIMFVHLVLNKRLRKDGVFIIDEPELSLHISWQDMFVDAIREASPNLQIILATHSPSIIGGRNHMHVPLNRGR